MWVETSRVTRSRSGWVGRIGTVSLLARLDKWQGLNSGICKYGLEELYGRSAGITYRNWVLRLVGETLVIFWFVGVVECQVGRLRKRVNVPAWVGVPVLA